LLVLFVYTGYGIAGDRKHPLLWPLLLLLTLLAVLFHTVGATWGLLGLIAEFEVTETATPDTVEEVSEGPDDGDLTTHGASAG